ncbi:hypothetical protein BH11PLA2_BH11PLA2_14500 [soil metagenome]
MRYSGFNIAVATSRLAIATFILAMLTGSMVCVGHQLQEFGVGPLTSDDTVSQFQPQLFIPPENQLTQPTR